MRRTEDFPRSKLSPDDVKRIIDTAAHRGIKIVSFTGGEPLLFLNELAMFIKYAGNAGIEYIRTGTNGFIFMDSYGTHFQSRIKRIAETLAATPLRNFWISIDSAIPSVHEKMRGFPGVIRGIEKALPIFHEHGIHPSANLGISRNIMGDMTGSLKESPSKKEEDYLQTFYRAFETAFKEFYQFVIELGFTIVSACYPMSIDDNKVEADLKPVYSATSEDPIVRFSNREKALLFKALLETLPEFRSQIRIFSPRTSLYALYRQYSNDSEIPYSCRGGIDFFFIDAKDGNTYPCGYRGNENLGKFWGMDRDTLDHKAVCYKCDWECFRDPSELLGPLLYGLSRPLDLFKKMKRDGYYFRLWVDDLKYYRACGFFNGRKPPDYSRLRGF
jgi:MoaA/NifB/PqqE/SkfB family radical SAM enzyme